MSLKLKNLTQSSATLATLCGTGGLTLKTTSMEEVVSKPKPKRTVVYRKVPNNMLSCNLHRYATNGDASPDRLAKVPTDGVVSVVNRLSNEDYTTFKIVTHYTGEF